MSDAAGTAPATRSPFAQARAAIEAHPGRAFAIFAVLHAAIWAFVPSVAFNNLTYDGIEAVAYGQEWPFLTWKHPGTPWWIADIVHRLAGTRLWAYFLAGQILVVTCMWTVWRLGREILPPLEALVAVVVLSGCFAFNFRGIELNHHTITLPLWGFAAWALYRAFTRQHTFGWVLAGASFALAFYGKFAAATLIIPLLLFSLLDREARASWRRPGPYLAMAVFAIMMVPQAVAYLDGSYDPIGFAATRAQGAQGGAGALAWHQVVFAANSLLRIAACLAMFAAVVGRPGNLGRGAAVPGAFARRYIAVLTFGPIATLLTVGLLSGRELRVGWAEHYWIFIGLFLVTWGRPLVDRAAVARLAAAWTGSTAIIAAGLIASEMFHVGGGARWLSQFPGAQLASSVTEAWRRETGRPLTYVVSDFWLAGNVILYSPERPSPRMFEDANPRYSPWIDEADLRRRGGVLLWSESQMPAALRARFPEAELREPIVLSRMTMRGEWRWRVNWAVLRPAEP